MYQILKKIKGESYLKWPNQIGGDPSKRNQSIYCHYHQDRGHTTKDCRTLCNYMDQLVKDRKLKQFLHQPIGQVGQAHIGYQKESATRPSLGEINVIFAAPRYGANSYSSIISVALKPKP